MDTQQFLAEFGHIANSPRGVSRLRELILALAMQGRLVERNPTESDVNNNLEMIEQLKLRLVEAKKIPRQKFIPELNKSEIPHSIPQHWMWVRFGNIAQHNTGKTLDKSKNTGVRRDYITTSNLYWGKFDLQDVKQVPIEEKELEKCTAIKGDLLICEGGEAGRAAVWEYDHNICFQNHVHRARFYDYVDPYFAFRLFQKISATGEINDFRKGIGISSMSGQSLASIPFPLPPIEEQSRIVAKVDELMALCDLLEAQQQERRTLQDQLRQATLQAVAASQSPHELKESWQRLQSNFGQLFSAPEHVDDAIAEIKNLAARGLLANAIRAKPDLEKIKADCSAKRDEYIASGLMRRQKLVGIADNETAYPEHWGVCAFDEVAIVIGGVTKGRNLQGKNIIICPYLSVANVQRGYFKLENLKSIEIVATELPKYVVESGDLLITEGGDWDKVGRTAIWREDASNVLHQNHVFKARVPTELIKNEWVELIFNSGIGRDYFSGASKQTTNLASINMTQLRSFPFPIPPQEEQKSILTVFSAIENECNEWRKKLERKQNLSAMFANATIASLTGIAIEQEEKPMKAPQTELVAPVRLGTPPDVKAQAPLATILARHNGEMSAKDLWQRFGGEIEVFYAQLKTEVAHGWVLEPKPAEMREKLDS